MKVRGITRFFQSFRNVIRRLTKHQDSGGPPSIPPSEPGKELTFNPQDLDVKSNDILPSSASKDKIRIKPKKKYPKPIQVKTDDKVNSDTLSVASVDVLDPSNKQFESEVAPKVPEKPLRNIVVPSEGHADHNHTDDFEKTRASSNASLSSLSSIKSSNAADMKQLASSLKRDSKTSLEKSLTSVSSSNDLNVPSKKTASLTNSDASLSASSVASGRAPEQIMKEDSMNISLSTSTRSIPTDEKPKSTQSEDATSSPPLTSEEANSASSPCTEAHKEVNNNNDELVKDEVFEMFDKPLIGSISEDQESLQKEIQDMNLEKENNDFSNIITQVNICGADADVKTQMSEDSLFNNISHLRSEENEEDADDHSKIKMNAINSSDLPNSDKSRSKVPPAVPSKPKFSKP